MYTIVDRVRERYGRDEQGMFFLPFCVSTFLDDLPRDHVVIP